MGAFAHWRQEGRISLWRYRRMLRMYAGWHFAADPAGCTSLLALLSLLRAASQPAQRMVQLSDARAAGLDGIFGAHELQVHSLAKLRLRFDSTMPAHPGDLSTADDVAQLTLSAAGLETFAAAIDELRGGGGDFSLGFDGEKKEEMKRISFWAWPRGD